MNAEGQWKDKSGRRCVIAIATYNRPSELNRCLESVVRQASRFSAAVIVVDNDADQSARPVVGAYETVQYVCEPTPGIASARNAAVRWARAEGAAYIAFLDDDEAASERWLETLLDAIESSGADAVTGPVVPRYPPGFPVPDAVRSFFEPPARASGVAVSRCSTANVIIRLAPLVRFRDEPFDVEFGLSGGSDSELFEAFGRAGHTFEWCQGAWVHDFIPAARLSAGWVSQRLRRYGNTDGRISLRTHKSSSVFLAAWARILPGFVQHGARGLWRRHGHWEGSARYLRGRGMLDAARGRVQLEYGRPAK